MGSVIASLAPNGAVTKKYSYSPFGLNGANNDHTEQPWGYTGQRYDGDSGLYYYKARYYHAGLGRFLSVDPVGYDDQMNLYAYVANSPLLYRDPSGRIIELIKNGASKGYDLASSAPSRLVDEFKDRVSVSAKFRAGVGPAIDTGPTVNNRELAETGSVRVDPGGGEGLGASGSLTVDVKLFEAGPVVNSPVLTNHTFCAGAGAGGCVNATFLDGRVFSLTVSGGIVGGMSFTNTIATPTRVKVFPDP